MWEIICRLLNYNGLLDVNSIENIFELRLTGIIEEAIYAKKINATIDIKNILTDLCNLNYDRNSTLKKETINLDKYLNVLSISRLWLKGIRDILLDSSERQQKIRKMVDCDLLVNKEVPIREILYDYGFLHGSLDRKGVPYYPKIEDVLVAEKNHYEYAAFFKIIPLEIKNADKIPNKYLNRFRVFKKNDGSYYTDYTLDVHHALANGVDLSDALCDNCFLPLIEDMEDTWYAMNKSYYEIYKGDSKDLQLLCNTQQKYNQILDKNKIKSSMKAACSNIYNERVFMFFEKLSVSDKELVDELVEKIKRRLNCV